MTTTLDFTDAYGEFSNYSEDGFTVTAIGGSGHFLIDGGLYEGLYDIRASEPGAEFSAISASVGGSPEGIPFTVQFTAIYANGSSFTKTFNAPGGGTLTFGPEFSDIVALASGFVEWVRPDTGALIVGYALLDDIVLDDDNAAPTLALADTTISLAENTDKQRAEGCRHHHQRRRRSLPQGRNSAGLRV